MHKFVKTASLYAASVALTAAGFIALIDYADQPGELAVPPPAPSPLPTLTPPAPAEQHEVPRPVTVEAAPAVEEPAEPPAGEIDPDLNRILLIIDKTIDPYWEVDEAADDWNRRMRCPVFKVVYTDDVEGYKVDPLQEHYRVVETPDVTYKGEIVHGLFDVGNYIRLNPNAGAARYVSAHELGHALGLHHDGHEGLMNVDNYDTDVPYAEEVAAALELQSWRCGPAGVLN